MRRFIICTTITPEIRQLAIDFSHGEIIKGIPDKYKKAVNGKELPVIVIESAVYPDVVLFIESIANTTVVALSKIEDFSEIVPITTDKERISTLEQIVIDLTIRLEAVER